jgi:hypothetical protein
MLVYKGLKSLSNTRWACRSEAVNAIRDNYDVLLKAIKEISDSSKHADVRVKGMSIFNQLKTFEFIFAMEMLHPILSLILKVSTCLQNPSLNLLSAVQIVESLKKNLGKMRNEESEFKQLYTKAIQICNSNNIPIPIVKNRKISSRIEKNPSSQYFINTKEEDIKITVYLPMLDNKLSGIEVRFHQETLAMITMIDRLIKMENSKDDILKLA